MLSLLVLGVSSWNQPVKYWALRSWVDMDTAYGALLFWANFLVTSGTSTTGQYGRNKIKRICRQVTFTNTFGGQMHGVQRNDNSSNKRHNLSAGQLSKLIGVPWHLLNMIFVQNQLDFHKFSLTWDWLTLATSNKIVLACKYGSYDLSPALASLYVDSQKLFETTCYICEFGETIC